MTMSTRGAQVGPPSMLDRLGRARQSVKAAMTMLEAALSLLGRLQGQRALSQGRPEYPTEEGARAEDQRQRVTATATDKINNSNRK
ncbi:hypothetical protein DIPPA_10273 [Diplonema papillatum]|nr:hypothetical protein DIPPA_10273 [Diplonema papillatum]